ncbi:hypothetical protein OQA88_3019 [Cercophora sp. LCS_1]
MSPFKFLVYYEEHIRRKFSELKAIFGHDNTVVTGSYLYQSTSTPVTLHCVYIDFDGKCIGPVSRLFEITRFDGECDITSLGVYALCYAGGALRQRLIVRGRMFLEVAGVKHMHYKGLTLDMRDEVDSQVVIDFEEAFVAHGNSEWRPQVKQLIDASKLPKVDVCGAAPAWLQGPIHSRNAGLHVMALFSWGTPTQTSPFQSTSTPTHTMPNRFSTPTLSRNDATRLAPIVILHPDYPPAERTLLYLRAVDRGGIDYDTALTTCGIIVGNIWSGFFAIRDQDTNALVPVARPADGILRGSSFFFQLPDADVADRPYPVVPRFQDWEFPHQSLPSPWKDLQLAVGSVGESCRMTDSMWALEKAHLVPLAAEEWWNREGLSRYLSLDLYSQKSIDANENSIRFRQDIHTVFDEKVFAIVPKFDWDDTTQASRPSLVTHIFNPAPDPYFNTRYHNIELLPVRCSVECLFARFAYTVFSPLSAAFFVSCQTSRRVRVHDPSTGTFTTETRNREQARALYAASQSRSVSPRKRSRPGDDGPGDHIRSSSAYRQDFGGAWDPDGSQADSGFGDRGTPSRGRSRKRPWEEDSEDAAEQQDRDARKRGRAEILVDSLGAEVERP